jgi:hypothetical protein
MKNSKMCQECPYRQGTKLNQHMDSVLPKIEADMKKGILTGPHACHMKTEEMIPSKKSEECIGHRLYLRGKYG